MSRSRTHTCPGGCGQRVSKQYFACRDCWCRLPGDLRRAIRYSAKREQVTLAKHRAAEWYGQHPPSKLAG